MTNPVRTGPSPAVQPTLGGRDIGITYFAISGVRDMLLADVGMTFEDSLLLTALTAEGGSVTRDDISDHDLAITQRVLATVAERANRELALTLRP